jgi:hypothetical protein
MKKILLLLSFTCIGMIAFSQKLSFSKGNIAPGKISSHKPYEDFLIGKIKVTDEAGVEYTFVKADFTEKTASGKTITLDLKIPGFPEEQRGDIIRAVDKGTKFTFSNIVVKDKTGKEYRIASVTYEFIGFE